MLASRSVTFLKRDSNTGKHLCWSPFLRKLQVLKPANLLKGEYCKIFKNTILVKICEQLLLQFLLLTVNISFGCLFLLNSVGLFQKSYSRFKKFSLGCLVVYSFVWKRKEKIAGMITRWHALSLVVSLVVIPYHSLSHFVIRCHSLSLVVIRCHSLYHSFSLIVPLVVIRCHSLSFVVTRCTTRCHSMYHSSVFL